MPILKHPTTSPPGGYVYIQTETKLQMVGDSLSDLTGKVVSHRRYKSLARATMDEARSDIERQICTRLGTDYCKDDGPADTWVPQPTAPRFTLMDILAFSKTTLEWIKGGGRLVSIDEAKRRRAICAVCPLNQKASGCKCAIFYKMVNAIVPRERKFDDLHVCSVCHCSLVAKVNVPFEVIDTDKRVHNWPVHCWLHSSNRVLPTTK